MPTVYGVSTSPFVRKVRVVLAEKRVTYELEPIVPVNVPSEYRQISPLGKVPAFRDGDRALADSSVICAYLERTHPEPPLYPPDPYVHARALWFEEYGDTALAETLTGAIFFQRIVAPRFLGRATDEAVGDADREQRTRCHLVGRLLERRRQVEELHPDPERGDVRQRERAIASGPPAPSGRRQGRDSGRLKAGRLSRRRPA